MAIEPVMADVIRKLKSSAPNTRALCLGYPDILATGVPPEDPELLSIARWHHWKGAIQTGDQFFAELGFTPEYWDVTQARGPEKIADLNTMDAAVGAWFKGEKTRDILDTYGLIVDPGTIEHIANIGNCWRTICAVLALNGLVIHCNPFTMANHGFYSIHPTAYVDIYEANGFAVEILLELSGPLDNRTIREIPRTHRYQPMPNAQTLVVARKVKEVPFTWPIQTKYRNNPNLKRAAE